MSVFSEVVIGFGNSKGETVLKLLSENQNKINRVNLKSTFGPNPKITIKPLPQVKLTPFTHMIYTKRQQSNLREMLENKSAYRQQLPNLSKITIKTQQLLQQLTSEIQILRSFHENEDIEKVTKKTGASQKEAKSYIKKLGTAQKAIQKLLENKKKIQEVAKKFNCSKEEAKNFLQANNYQMSLLGE